MSLHVTTWYKVLSFFVIFFSGLLGGLVPLKYRTSQKFVNYGNYFSGGIFLAVAFLHLLKESVDQDGNDPKSKIKEFFPYYFLLAGTLVPMFIENLFGNNASTSDFLRRGIVSTFILWINLAVHSMIEGIALGMKNTVESIATMMIAIFSHKLFSAFSLGISLSNSGISNLYSSISILVFSLTTPFGIIFGHFLNSAFSSVEDMKSTHYFDAFAAGTFIYIALVEILSENHNHHHHFNTPNDSQQYNVHHCEHSCRFRELVKSLLIVSSVVIMATFLYYFDS